MWQEESPDGPQSSLTQLSIVTLGAAGETCTGQGEGNSESLQSESVALCRWLNIHTEGQRNKLGTKHDQILQDLIGETWRETQVRKYRLWPQHLTDQQKDQYFLASLGYIGLFFINK